MGEVIVDLTVSLDGPIALEQTRVIESDGVPHLRYRVVRG